ncbi:MAG TPA: hypothetical protein DIU15_18095 [Deltaproteobacteria bacterium]|nr:hypothetical protein [Deltaproteobacteria bacterium]
MNVQRLSAQVLCAVLLLAVWPNKAQAEDESDQGGTTEPSDAPGTTEDSTEESQDEPSDTSNMDAAAALKAAEVLDEHCADVAAGKATESAQALSTVGPVLAEVSAAHDASGAPYLLYWRGRLNLCLDREARAEEDLSLFLEAVGEDPAYRTQTQQAMSLLRRTARANKPAGLRIQRPEAAVAGVVALSLGGVFGGLSAWQWSVASTKQQQYLEGGVPWSQTDQLGHESSDAQDRHRALLGLSLGSSVAGIVSLALSTLTPKGAARSTAGTVAPLPGGVVVGLETRW